MLTREELNEQFGNVWVHFVSYYKKTFTYMSEEGDVWVYINLDFVLERGCFLPQAQCIENLYFMDQVFVGDAQIYQKNS